jgi:hypothetical protein
MISSHVPVVGVKRAAISSYYNDFCLSESEKGSNFPNKNAGVRV